MGSTEKQYLETKQRQAIDDLKEHGELAKVIIIRLADATAALIQNGYLEGERSDVCSIVLKIKRKEGLNFSDTWAREVLPDYYKHVEFDSHELSEPTVALPEVNEETAKDDEILDAIKTYEDAASETVRRKNAYSSKAQNLRAEAVRRKLSVSKESSVTSTEDNPGDSASHTALLRLVNLLEIVAGKVYKFKPVAHDEEIAREIELLFLALRPLADEKWSDSLPYWFRTQQLNIAFGKHAAGSKSATKTPEGIERKITREQVGDRYPTIVEMAARIMHEEMPDLMDGEACEELLKRAEDLLGPEGILWLYMLSVLWHKKSVAPRIAKRKVQMHDQFSESS